jgi:hypothetical protein
MKYHRRSFACSDETWQELQEITNECFSVSEFIRDAIKLKLEVMKNG